MSAHPEQLSIRRDTRGDLQRILSSDAQNRARLMRDIREALRWYAIDPNNKNDRLEVLPITDSVHAFRLVSPYGITMEITLPSVRNSSIGKNAIPQKYWLNRIGNLAENHYFVVNQMLDRDELLQLILVFFSLEEAIFMHRKSWTAQFIDHEGIWTHEWVLIRDFSKLSLEKKLKEILTNALREILFQNDTSNLDDKSSI